MECSAKYASISEDDGAWGAELDAVGVGSVGIDADEGSATVFFFFLSFLERFEEDGSSGAASSVTASSRLRFFFFSGSEERFRLE